MAFLMHEGTPHQGPIPHSGRYEWGSGDNPYQRVYNMYAEARRLKKQGVSDRDIAKGFGISEGELRRIRSAGADIARQDQTARILMYKDKGYSVDAIAEKTGIPKSTIRLRIEESEKRNKTIIDDTAAALRQVVQDKTYVDISAGVNVWMGLKESQLTSAITKLKEEGYNVVKVPYTTIGSEQETYMSVLVPPDVDWRNVKNNMDKISLPGLYLDNDTDSVLGIKPPVSVDSSRVYVRYGDQGGAEKDGLIELRRDVPDLSLGDSKYAQVRIAVDGTHYLKGMAAYGIDIPEGYDIVFNTNKKTGTPLMLDDPDAKQVFKHLESDPDNPFKTVIKQQNYIDADGKEKQSPINLVAPEGDRENWTDTLASQFLSKQTPALAQKQLDIAYQLAKEQFDQINSFTNPTVKEYLMDKFADQCDYDAVDLAAAAMPRQSWNYILPVPSVSEREVYAPNYCDGERVVLIRYPHGGIFEIPELTVNNKNPEAKALLGDARDAIGINSVTAGILSGADFDGDSVIVIPTSGQIKTRNDVKNKKALEDLKAFDPKSYALPPDAPKVTSRTRGFQMGSVSNLITDMTIQGAPIEDICKAVKHSMVVIDSEKHHLDWQQSYKDNDIAALKEKYQGGANKGSYTLISKSTSEEHPYDRQEKRPYKMTDEERRRYEEGYKVYEPTGKTKNTPVKDKDGNVIGWKKELKRTTSTKGAETEDAYTLSSGTYMENIYADYVNKMKTLARQARAISRKNEDLEYQPSAYRTYADEVASLKSKLNVALKDQALERTAQLIANSVVKMKKKENPKLYDRENEKYLKKMETQAIITARKRVRTAAGQDEKRSRIFITDKEWEAIQAGAVHKTTLQNILKSADLDRVRSLATPRTKTGLSAGQLARAKSMRANDYTSAQIAEALGVSVSTLSKALNE